MVETGGVAGAAGPAEQVGGTGIRPAGEPGQLPLLVGRVGWSPVHGAQQLVDPLGHPEVDGELPPVVEVTDECGVQDREIPVGGHGFAVEVDEDGGLPRRVLEQAGRFSVADQEVLQAGPPGRILPDGGDDQCVDGFGGEEPAPDRVEAQPVVLGVEGLQSFEVLVLRGLPRFRGDGLELLPFGVLRDDTVVGEGEPVIPCDDPGWFSHEAK